MDNDKKILVAFFSRTGENYAVGNIEKGNTHIVAEFIAEATTGNLFQIEPVNPYPTAYDDCVEIAKTEKGNNTRPEVKGDIAVEDYDVVFLGYPNWWGDMPMAVYTFIEKHDWNGKTVIPFCTHEGSGLSGTKNLIAKSCKGATVADGMAIRGEKAQNSKPAVRHDIEAWIDRLGLRAK